ncbi:transcription activator acu-15 [Fusarium mexicanum]|uniref:Transcription activator acu-15 n=1 Tax=Fusarium mexicanum TaxID=751941 RepID=A0A8H5ICS1_9HYPO|nr:transcription activator acu-15 [Fusarium mexicanum]
MGVFGFRGRKLQMAQIWAVILPCYLLFGYNNSIAGGFLSLPPWVETFPALDTVHAKGAAKDHNSTHQGTVVAMYTLGCLFGCLSCIWLGDKLGRKKTIISGALINTIGAALQASSYSLPQLIVGRLVSGYGFGHITATAPNWQAECSGAAHRGAAVMLEGLFISLGLAIGGWKNLGMSFHHGSITFRFPMALSGVFSIIIMLTTPLLPESPRWLTKKGRIDRAREVLADLTNTDANSIEDIFTNGPLRLLHRMCLACAAQCFQQMSGINALAFYQAKIFEDYLGQTPRAAKIIAASVFPSQTICSPIGVLTVDRFGRRKLMMVSSLGMGICMAVVAGGSSQPGDTASVGVAAAFIFLFSLFFPTGFLGLTFLHAAEISPLSHGVPITAMSIATAWLFNFVVAEITPTGLATLKYKYYIIYAAINICLTFPYALLMSQSPTESSSARPVRRRPRGLVVCRRCKSRKQRCDNEFPACSNYLGAGEKCSYSAKQAYPAEYVKSLERQISKLQDEISSSRQNVVSTISRSTIQQQTLSMVDAQSGVNEAEPARSTETAASDLEASAGIVAPSPDSFLGTSSGYPLTKLLRSALPSSVDARQSHQAGTSHQINLAARSLIGVPVSTGLQVQSQKISDGLDLPSKEIGDKLIEAYYTRVHPKHPFLPRKRVQTLHEARFDLVPAHKAVLSGGVTKGCDYVTLQLVYAIGARYLQLSNDDDHYSSPKRHYACAMADADSIFATGNLESLEAMLLLTIYQLRSPTGPGVWWMIETTMRHCIDNGLHRQAPNVPPTLDERRKRIFWTAYILERSVARTMGRPYSISAIVESSQHPAEITALTPAIHIFRLQQIDSKISYTVCRVDKDVSEIKPHKVTRLRKALEEWKAAIPQTDPRDKPHPYLTTDYHMIQYHKAIILLNLPFLPTLTPQSPTFHEIVHSAGQVCSLSKRLHDQQTYISFSLLSLHANFVAGLVMVYCFCLDLSIFSPKFSSSVRACSTMLYIISERWPRAVQARNSFDCLVAATIESQHDENNDLLRTEDDVHVSQDGFVADESGHLEVWNSFESILEDHQIDLGT